MDLGPPLSILPPPAASHLPSRENARQCASDPVACHSCVCSPEAGSSHSASPRPLKMPPPPTTTLLVGEKATASTPQFTSLPLRTSLRVARSLRASTSHTTMVLPLGTASSVPSAENARE